MDIKRIAQNFAEESISPQEFVADLDAVFQINDPELLQIARDAFITKCILHADMDIEALSFELTKFFTEDVASYFHDLAVVAVQSIASDQFESELKRAQVVQRLIKRNPEDNCLSQAPFRYFTHSDLRDLVEKEWKRELSSDSSNPCVLVNAASFYFPFDEQEAMRILKMGQDLEPDNSFWEERLAVLARLHSQ